MPDDVTLVGLDFGTTTSSAVAATASLTQGAATGRLDFGPIRERYRSETIFTPLDEHDRLDVREMERILDAWLTAGQLKGTGPIIDKKNTKARLGSCREPHV